MIVTRIVVGVDLAPPSSAAARWVGRHFDDADVTLVHGVDAPAVPAFLRGQVAPDERLRARAVEDATASLATLARTLGPGRAHVEVRAGQPWEAILAAARQRHADLVVVGAPTTPGRVRPGRTRFRVMRHATIPVLVCPGTTGLGEATPQRILVALDDADVTPAVLCWTAALATRFDAQVIALHVVSTAVLGHVMATAARGTPGAPGARGAAAPDFREAAGRWMRGVVSAALDPARVTSAVDFGEPGDAILAAAERTGAALIVVGAHGAGTAGAAGRALDAGPGSVAGTVVCGARCPVLLVGAGGTVSGTMGAPATSA